MNELIKLSKSQLLEKIKSIDPFFWKIVKSTISTEEKRKKIFYHLNNLEGRLFTASTKKEMKLPDERIATECLRVLKNLFMVKNETITGFSLLSNLVSVAHNKSTSINNLSEGALIELVFLFDGIHGDKGLFSTLSISKKKLKKTTVQIRSLELDAYAQRMKTFFDKYNSNSAVSENRNLLKTKILNYFRAEEKDWTEYKWHLDHIIMNPLTLKELIHLEKDEIEGLEEASRLKIRFRITPFYLSLFNPEGRNGFDRVLRAQVLPSKKYCQEINSSLKGSLDRDYMGEKATSPVELITRRYPQIVILKPFVSCPQLCVYCQRSWELNQSENYRFDPKKVTKAIKWIEQNENISEVLITGGDPLVLDNGQIEKILFSLNKICHVVRIRIGTRMIVTLPQRFDKELIMILKKYHNPGKQELCIITHFEHSSEITGEAAEVIKKIKNKGISVYNQQVFTYFNSKKFETAFLRKNLRFTGIDPYYSFTIKGQNEISEFRVPIARIKQERKEEARLLPGLERTDTPVFNIPKLGKIQLDSKDHDLIMILADGSRVYRFYPWDNNATILEDCLYTDVPIYDYLLRLKHEGENLENYNTIYYFF